MKSVISRIAAGYIWLVYRTSRWQIENADLPNRYVDEGKPFIMAFWHGRLLMMSIANRPPARAHVLISRHGDGELIARTIKHWNLDSIRGSTSRGSVPALKEILRVIRKKEIVVITPDGPRGPRMRAQDGVVRIAALTGVPVFPVSYSTTRGRFLKSWDRFFLAKPFSRGVMLWGDPIEVARQEDPAAYEDARLEIENRLNELTREADLRCGHEPVEPADPADPAASVRAAKKVS
ncbi:lysophospholipid acyltransferase family protein [Sneathiella chinensis]|nr:lysophospholipid acyltransferase family protein [Sneathiella chinensis]